MAGGERQLTPAGEVLATPDASGNYGAPKTTVKYILICTPNIINCTHKIIPLYGDEDG